MASRVPGPVGAASAIGGGPHDEFTCIDERGVASGYWLPGPVGTLECPDGTEPYNRLIHSPYSDFQLLQAEEELKLLEQIFAGIVDQGGKATYIKRVRGKKVYDAEAYLNDRVSFFGSDSAYFRFREEGKRELDADTALREVVPPHRSKRGSGKPWQQAQDVFYAWLRKAYKKKVGGTADVPSIIQGGRTKELREALKKVKVDYSTPFTDNGGFLPRPMKAPGTFYYRLGTLSEHALGNAIDVESASNAFIPDGQFRRILAFTGKTSTESSRRSTWTTNPKGLHDLIVEINDEFVRKLKQIVDARPATETGETRLLEALKADPHLDEKKDLRFCTNHRSGFFSLPLGLVRAFHKAGFKWGAVFSSPDLHHFELPSTP